MWLLIIACSGKELDTAQPQTSWAPVLENDGRGAIMSLWQSPDDGSIWAVGGQANSGLVLKSSDNPRTASSWQELDYEDEVPLLNWVHGTSSSDVWVGGLNGAVLHWNGSSWTDHSLDIEEAIWGVYSFPDHIIAVGGSSRWGGSTAFFSTFDRQDESWSNHPLPSELQGLSNFFKVGIVGSGENLGAELKIWAIGAAGSAAILNDDTLEAVPTGSAADLVTLHHHEGRTTIVGGRGTGTIATASTDGVSFIGQTMAGLNGVFTLSDEQAFVAGERGYSAIVDLSNGALEEMPIETLDVMHTTLVTDTHLIAAGGNLFTSEATFHGSLFARERQ